MMNDITNEYNRKNTYKMVCHTWRLGGSGIGNFKFKGEEGGGERRGKQKKKFSGGLPY